MGNVKVTKTRKYKPVSNEASIEVRMTHSMHAQLRAAAMSEGTSVNQWVVDLIGEALEQRKDA